ncbi:replicative DNA helicase [Chitiniphilus eburneus]|uniref:DNA 5'-3' helicase n=1 Tax=Chitiniphilus eburneus TaxID=2571148 RepID=A0A4U0Q3D1_9NEIS|nr:replicative DNA helicase [Chitiniphilus eburneus]TJZ75601.1 replicative DNA helicase [Chitiniphilus eburneus]
MTAARYDSATELALIGAVLADNSAFDRVADQLSVEDFATQAGQLMWAGLCRLLSNGVPAEIFSLAEALDESGDLERIGGLAQISEAATALFVTGSVATYARIIRDLAKQRKLGAAAVQIHEILEGTGDTDSKIAESVDVVMRVAEHSTRANVMSAVEMAMMAGKAILDRDEKGESGLRWGFRDIDAIAGRMKPGQLIIIAARPGMGKTTFARNVAEHVAQSHGVLHSSLEMEHDELSEGYVASLGQTSYESLQTGKLEDQYIHVTRGIERLSSLNLAVVTGLDTVAALASTVRIQARKLGGIKLVIVDYLQLMRSPGQKDRRVEVDEISRDLKKLAIANKCTVIALSQLSRKVEERSDKRPMISDIRESGGIEADADKVIALYRDDYYHPSSPYKGLAEAGVLKNRRGKTGKVPLAFLGDQARFADSALSLDDIEYEVPRPAKRFGGEPA